MGSGDNIPLLLVEDDTRLAGSLADFLSEHGYDVDFAFNGLHGVELARRNDYAVIVMDVSMPEMDGWDAFSQIRSLSNDVPIVLMSGFTNVETDRRLAGNHPPFLSKPFRSAELVAKIQQAMAG